MVGVGEVSESIGSPRAFTAKILQQLAKAGLLDSVRGPNGGFRLNQDKKVTLADVVKVMDGPQILEGCVLGFSECSSINPCPVHHKFIGVRDYLAMTLESTSLEELGKFMDVERTRLRE